MDIKKLNNVQKTVLTYTPTKYAKTDEQQPVKKEDTLMLTEDAKQLLAQRKESKQKSMGVIDLSTLTRKQDYSKKKQKKNKSVNMSKCFRIAARIGNGDKVPLKDLKFLRENAPELYKNALLFKKHNPEPKKYKSCLDKEDEIASKNRQDAMFDTSAGADDAMVLCLDE